MESSADSGAAHPLVRGHLSDHERSIYFYHLPSRPMLVARTSTDGPLLVDVPFWGQDFRIIKQMRPVGDHPLRESWEDNIAFKIHHVLDSLEVQWTSTDLVRIGECGKAFEPPVVLWIGVRPGSLNVQEGTDLVHECQKILLDHGIDDVEVEVRESDVVRWTKVGPRQQNPTGEGTGGFFLNESSQRKRLLLVTARHALLPPEVPVRHDSASQFVQISFQPPEIKISVLEPQEPSNHVYEPLDTNAGDNSETGGDLRQAETRYWEHQLKLQIAKDLNLKLDEKLPLWMIQQHLETRFIGRIAVSPPLRPGAGDPTEGYTEDWAAIEVDPSKLKPGAYPALNVLDFHEMDIYDWLRLDVPHSFGYPGFLPLGGVVSDKELRAEPTELDERANEPIQLIVTKRGNGTGLTVGRANNVCSYVRTTYLDTDAESSSSWATRVSKEWPILPLHHKAEAFAGPGDSGAMVVDNEGRYVGMITGGAGYKLHEEELRHADLVYLTPMTFLLKRMEETGLVNIDLNPCTVAQA